MKEPRLRLDLIISQQLQRGVVVYVIKDQLDGQYYKFGEMEYTILSLLDGTRNAKQILKAAQSSLPDLDLEASDLKDFISSVNKMNLLEKSLEEKNSMLVARLREDRKSQLLSKKGSLMYKRFPVFDPDQLFDRIHPYLKFFWKKPFVICCLLLMASSGCILLYHWREVLEGVLAIYSFHGQNAHSVFILWITVLTVIALHEFAHGLTCKNFGGHVHEIGFLLLFFQPCMYCNVNDAYAFTNKRHKLYTVFAGGFFEFLLGSIFAYLWLFSNRGTTVNALAYQAMTICGLSSVLFNFNPLMKFDGYYALADYLELPNLKQESFGYLKAVVRKHIFHLGDTSEFDHFDRSTRRALLIYGICSFIYMSSILIGLVFIVKMFVLDSLKELGLLIIMLVAFKMLGPHVTKSFAFLKEFMVMKNIKLLSLKGAGVLAVFVVILYMVLFAVPFSNNMISTCSLVAMNKLVLRTAVSGRLAAVNFNHCDRVPAGVALVVLENREIERALVDKEMELESLEFQQRQAAMTGDAYRTQELETRIGMLRAEIERLKIELESLKITVPEEAILLTENMDFEIGRVFSPGDVVAELLPTATINAEITLFEEDVGKLAGGVPIKLKLNAFPRVIFPGNLVRVLPNETEAGKQKQFAALAEFSNQTAKQMIYPGMQGVIKVALPATTGFRLLSGWLIRTFRFDMMFF